MAEPVKVVISTMATFKANIAVGDGFEFKDTGIERLDPPLYWTPALRGAFTTFSDRVEIIGDKHVGAFSRTDDFVRVKVMRGRLVGMRHVVYEFSGWQDRP